MTSAFQIVSLDLRVKVSPSQRDQTFVDKLREEGAGVWFVRGTAR